MTRTKSGAAFMLAAMLLPAPAISQTAAPQTQNTSPKENLIVNKVTFDKIVFDNEKSQDRGPVHARFTINDNPNLAFYVSGRSLFALGKNVIHALALASPRKKSDGFDHTKVQLMPANSTVLDAVDGELVKARESMLKALKPEERHWIMVAVTQSSKLDPGK